MSLREVRSRRRNQGTVDAYDPGADRRRRAVLGGSVAVGVVVGLVALKCAVTLAATEMGERSWEKGDPESALGWFSAAHHVNVAERWIAPYNSGVAAYGLGQWQRSAEYFADARQTVPEHALCRVVINQVLAIEAHGDALDAKDDPQGAQAKYSQAQSILAEAEGCAADSEDAGADGEDSKDEESQSESSPEEAESDADAGKPGEPEDSDEGESGDGAGEGQGAGEGEGEGDGDSGGGSQPGQGQNSGSGAGGQGPMSEQEQVDAANARLSGKLGGRTAPAKEKQGQGPTSDQADELAERNTEGARQAQKEQDGAGAGADREAGRTW